MMRSRGDHRNVFLHNGRKRSEVLGGLCLAQGAPTPVTHETFFRMVEIVVIVQGRYRLEYDDGNELQRDEEPLMPGHYYVVPHDDVEVEVNNEPVLTRTISLATGTRIRAFTDAVRERDDCCLITREPVFYNDYRGFQAAHIFPLAYQQHWNQSNYSRWITIMPRTGGAINSVQNGLLMRSDMHQLFDTYLFSINPDDNYKIIWFSRRGCYGHTDGALPRHILDDYRRPADGLLRWHFRQSVLANMRGAGEPLFEHDFPPGSDMLEDIRTGPLAAERMEAELFGRFALQLDLDDLDSDAVNDESGSGDEDANS